MVTTGLIILGTCVFLQRMAELHRAAENRAWALAAGAREYGKSHYPCFLVLHAGWLFGWLVEGYWRQEYSQVWSLWLGLFCVTQGLRYWCINSLGRCWNTRILVLPGSKLIRHGPYRYLRHPNYLVVVIELICVPLIFNAWFTAAVISVLNALLLLFIRIPAEEAALRESYPR